MPKICTPLTDTAIRNAKPRDKTYTLGDGEGMYLEIMPNGTKFWRSVQQAFKRIPRQHQVKVRPLGACTVQQARADGCGAIRRLHAAPMASRYGRMTFATLQISA